MARVTRNPSTTFEISPETFDQLDDWINAAKLTGQNVRYGLEILAQLLAITNQGFAQQLSAGPIDPGKVGKVYTGRHFIGSASGPSTQVPHFDSTAWKIPVRRITSNYYRGWKVKRIVPGVWALYNNSREAYFIEYGINHVGHTRVITYRGGQTFLRHPRRVRRPIQKMSLIRTLKYVEQSHIADKVWSAIYAPFRSGREFASRGELSALGQIQSAATGMRFI